jgi:hypothetical protein
MWGSENSIEPVRGAAAPLIREATAADLAAPRPRNPAPDPVPVQAVPEGRGSLFRRRPAEPDKPDAVAQQHGLYTTAKGSTRRYYADYQQKREVMRADPKRISTKHGDKQTVSAMLDLAQSRGWDTVRLKGTADFQREAWVQAQVRGMKAEGYKPTATDQQELARRKAAVAPVQAPVAVAVPVQASAPKVAPMPAAESTAPAAAAPKPRRATAARRPDVEAAPDKAKMPPAQRSKAVWGAVEAAGQQARAGDPAAAKAAAGERAASASVQ